MPAKPPPVQSVSAPQVRNKPTGRLALPTSQGLAEPTNRSILRGGAFIPDGPQLFAPEYQALLFFEERQSCSKSIQQPTASRSEEHTSELQSLMRISYAVFCLKTQQTNTDHHHHRPNSDNTSTLSDPL